jgi:DNA adenine methylase
MLGYIGGKSKISSWIVPFYPTDIEVYVEPFSGMYWCFFGMDLVRYPNLKKVVYNDFNPLNTNLYKCVRDHQRLLQECNKLIVQQKGVFPTNPLCKESFDKFQKELYDKDFVVGSEPNYEVAAKYAYILSQVFSGANPSSASFIDLKGKYHSKFTSFKNKLANPKWQKMFEYITDVENMDFADVIQKYDSPSTYIYLDPPYWKTENYYSNHDFDRQDHERLANVLHNIQGKFSLSYYDFELLHQWFPEDQYTWVKKEFAKAASAKKGEKQNLGEELLIMNY